MAGNTIELAIEFPVKIRQAIERAGPVGTICATSSAPSAVTSLTSP